MLPADESSAIHATTLAALVDDEQQPESARKWHADLEARQKVHALYGSRVQPGESVCWFYSWDMARCTCKPTCRYSGIPGLPVGRSAHKDRCLQCGKSWRTPEPGERVAAKIRRRKEAA